MVTAAQLLNEPPAQWLTAQPLWQPYAEIDKRPEMRRPALLRFASDTFMDDFVALMATSPERLGEWHAIRETWRRPAPTPSVSSPNGGPSAAETLHGDTEDQTLDDDGHRLKLYMPAHQRYYLVTANLVCRIPGLPDRALNASKGEQVSFVVRRLLGGKENAFVDGGWLEIEADALLSVADGESEYPLFPISYQEFDGRTRRLFAGLVPVSQREKLMTARRPGNNKSGGGAPANATPDDIARIDQLLAVANADVFAPWQEIISAWAKEDAAIIASWNEVPGDERNDLRNNVHAVRDRLQTQSWYTLLDFAYFLDEHLHHVWQRIFANPDAPVPAGTPGKALIDKLQATRFKPGPAAGQSEPEALQEELEGTATAPGDASLAKALKAAWVASEFLETTTVDYAQGQGDWPDTLFLLSGVEVRDALAALADAENPANTGAGLLHEALNAKPPDPAKRIPLAPQAQAIIDEMGSSDYASDEFVIRCVFHRPNCPLGVRPEALSEPTEPFQMAAYMDPDAPIRPTRIPMPVDTSPAGLRKHARNTMFMLSDTLACQVQKARGLTFGDLVLSVLPWPFHKNLSTDDGGCEDGSLAFGMLCTLSIPIITICALILLIIIVGLLDIIFKWVPYLIFCLPLPGLKAKGSSA